MIKNRLKELLTKKGYTQKQFAEQLAISESAVQKWAVAKNDIPLSAALEILSILNCTIGELIPDLALTSVTDSLREVNENTSKPIEYCGLQDIKDGLHSYNTDYMMLGEVGLEWAETNRFVGLLSATTEPHAIRDFGRYCISGADFICKEYVPVHFDLGSDESIESIAERFNAAKAAYENMLAKARALAQEEEKKPLIVVERIVKNSYRAFSLDEDKFVEIIDYKAYRPEKFMYIQKLELNEFNIINNDTYVVYTPTEEEIELFDLQLAVSPYVWNKRMPWDYWEPRPIKNPIEGVPTHLRNLYNESLRLINRNHQSKVIGDELIARLELRVEDLEEAIEEGAPAIIVDGLANEMSRLLDAIPPLEFDF